MTACLTVTIPPAIIGAMWHAIDCQTPGWYEAHSPGHESITVVCFGADCDPEGDFNPKVWRSQFNEEVTDRLLQLIEDGEDLADVSEFLGLAVRVRDLGPKPTVFPSRRCARCNLLSDPRAILDGTPSPDAIFEFRTGERTATW